MPPLPGSLLFFKLLCLVPNSQQKISYGEDDVGMCMWWRTVHTMVYRKQRVWQEPEVGYNSNMSASSDLLPSARIWFLKVSQPPQIVPSQGGTGRPNQSLWGHFSTNPSHVLCLWSVHTLQSYELTQPQHIKWNFTRLALQRHAVCWSNALHWKQCCIIFILPLALDEVNHFLLTNR